MSQQITCIPLILAGRVGVPSAIIGRYGAQMNSNTLSMQPFKPWVSVVVPALLIAALSVYVLNFKAKAPDEPRALLGKPLAAFAEYYPIRVNETGGLFLDKDRFEKAIDFLSANPSPRAVADVSYLGNSNHVTLVLSEAANKKYAKLSVLPDYAAVAETDAQKDKLLQDYKDIVNGIGQTFAGTPIEIVLHDTRNPLKSIVAVQNPISGRRLGDTNTNFGIQLIKNYSLTEGRAGGQPFISYGLSLKDGRSIKSTTIPIFNDTYVLIAFICINIDISKMNGRDPAATEHFIEAFKAVTDNEAISEMIQNSKRKNSVRNYF